MKTFLKHECYFTVNMYEALTIILFLLDYPGYNKIILIIIYEIVKFRSLGLKFVVKKYSQEKTFDAIFEYY